MLYIHSLVLSRSQSQYEKVLVSAGVLPTMLSNTEFCVQKNFFVTTTAQVWLPQWLCTLTLRWQPPHLFLCVSGDAGPLVFLNTVGPEVCQVLCAVPTPKQVHSLCQERFHKKKWALNNKPHPATADHRHYLCIPYLNRWVCLKKHRRQRVFSM